MAKNTGVLKFHGTLQELTFYKTQDGDIVRTKGGVEKSRIMSDPAFARTRENMSEFAHSATTGKIIRHGANLLLQNARDNRVTSRFAQTLHRILKLDTVNLRGARTVEEGLSTAQGKQLLIGFDFNIHAPLNSVFRNSVMVDETDGTFMITDFVPSQELTYPTGATHVKLQGGILHLDLTTGTANLTSSVPVTLPIDPTEGSVTLVGATPVTGTNLHLLLVEFLQETNGVQYPLSASYNALGIIGVVEV